MEVKEKIAHVSSWNTRHWFISDGYWTLTQRDTPPRQENKCSPSLWFPFCLYCIWQNDMTENYVLMTASFSDLTRQRLPDVSVTLKQVPSASSHYGTSPQHKHVYCQYLWSDGGFRASSPITLRGRCRKIQPEPDEGMSCIQPAPHLAS